jgi:hypothetical protein
MSATPSPEQRIVVRAGWRAQKRQSNANNVAVMLNFTGALLALTVIDGRTGPTIL